MAMIVQHNLQAVNSNRLLGITTSLQTKSTEKLSSGYKINRAADDAAGLTISEKMRKQVRGLDRASTNAQDGVSAVQTAEGALTEVHDMLQRMNELAVQSANGTNSQSDRDAIQAEIDQLVTEIDRVSETTKFNEIYLLKGDETEQKTVYTYKQKDIPASATIKDGSTLYGADGTAFTAETLAQALDADPKTKIYAEDPTGLTAAAEDTDYTKTSTGAFKTGTTSLFKADGTEIDDADDIATAAAAGKLYTAALTPAVDANFAGTNATDVNTAKLYKIDGTVGAIGGVQYQDKGDYYSVDPTTLEAAEDTHYTITDSYEIIDGMEVYDADGNKLDADGLKAALDASEDVYTSAAELAKSGDDYTFKASSKELAKLYDKDGKEVAANKIDDILAAGEKLYSDKEANEEVAEADLDDYTTSNTVNAALKFTLHVGADSEATNKIAVEIDAMSAAGIGVAKLKVDTEENATNAIDTIAAAIQHVSSQRSAIGAVQNRLEHTISNLDNIVENTTAAESRIRDTDMAEEMVEYSKNNILAQAGQSMLAQANQSTQGVLSLLQ